MASLSIRVSGGKPFPFCGASIVRKRYPAVILTAAHCLQEVRKYDIYVDLYRDDVYPEEEGDSGSYTQWKAVHTVYHEHFNETTFENDIGLLFLDTDLSAYDEYQEVVIVNRVV